MHTKYEVRPVVGYEGLYSVSNAGEVFSLNYNRTGQVKQLKPGKDKDGYLHVRLYRDGKTKNHFVHRLVLEAFTDNPDNKQFCDHIDANPANNILSNLRWATYTENRNNPITKAKHIGKTRSEQHRKNISEARKDKTIYTFRQKTTNEEFIGTRYEFYTKYDLDKSGVGSLIHGKHNHHKNWVLV